VKLNPQVTVAFTGAIEQESATEALKLLIEVIVIVEVVELPMLVVAETGEALKLKLFTVIPKFTLRD
jgi:hypothetical protein